MKINRLIISLSILIIIVIFSVKFYSAYSRLTGDYHQLVQDYSIQTSNNREMLNYLHKKDSLEIISEGFYFDIHQFINEFGNLSQTSQFIDIYSSYEKLLIISVSEKQCNSCYAGFFDVLNQYNIQHTSIKPIILSNFNNKRNLDIFIKKNHLAFDVINVNNLPKLPILEFDAPFMFTLNNDNVCQNVYAVDRSNINFSNVYLNTLLNKK